MRRADRLLQIIQILRRDRRPVTARRLSDELEVSIRTIYRDMVALESTGVPIAGEAGVGYVLDESFDMPPLMFTSGELEAIMLGARMVEARCDPALVNAARDVVAKVAAVIPASLRNVLLESPLYAPHYTERTPEVIDTAIFREAITKTTKVRIAYRDEKGHQTRRTIWPIALGYWQSVNVVASWCELRSAYRHFRTDRVIDIENTGEPIPVRRRELLKKWRSEQVGISGLQ